MGRGEFGRRQPREAEKGWERDDEGRLYRLEAGSRAYRTIEDRDTALEAVYTARPCEPDCCRSILCGVSSHRDELVEQYMAWCARRVVQEAHHSETLAQWERERFGARLYLAAHAVLLYAVRVARFGERKPRKPQPRTLPGLSNTERRERMLVALDTVAEGKTMPGRMSGREWDERRREVARSAESRS